MIDAAPSGGRTARRSPGRSPVVATERLRDACDAASRPHPAPLSRAADSAGRPITCGIRLAKGRAVAWAPRWVRHDVILDMHAGKRAN